MHDVINLLRTTAFSTSEMRNILKNALLPINNNVINKSLQRVVNKFINPSAFSEPELKSLTQLCFREFYDFRNMFVEPFCQNQPQFKSFITKDSLALLFLLKAHHNPSDRLLGSIWDISKSYVNDWVSILDIQEFPT